MVLQQAISGRRHYYAPDLAASIQHAALLHCVEITFRAPPVPMAVSAAEVLALAAPAEASEVQILAEQQRAHTIDLLTSFPVVLYKCADNLEDKDRLYEWLSKASSRKYEPSVWQEFLYNPLNDALKALLECIPLEDVAVVQQALIVAHDLSVRSRASTLAAGSTDVSYLLQSYVISIVSCIPFLLCSQLLL